MTEGPDNPYTPPKADLDDGRSSSGCGMTIAWGAGAALLNYLAGILLFFFTRESRSTELDPEIGAVVLTFWMVFVGPLLSLLPAGLAATVFYHGRLGYKGMALVVVLAVFGTLAVAYLQLT